MRRLFFISIALITAACAEEKSEPRAKQCMVPTNSQLAALAPPIEFLSQVRNPNEDWQVARDRNLSRIERIEPLDVQDEGPTAVESAQIYRIGIDSSFLPDWPSTSYTLQEAFELARDETSYKDRSHPELKRRANWLYPHDGCSARAAHTARVIGELSEVRPGKVFLFGNLKLRTPYSPRGKVEWWYHTAAAVEVNGEAYVLDAAVEPIRPLRLNEWVTRMSNPLDSLKIAFCDTYAYTARDTCVGATPTQDARSRAHIQYFLPYEWSTLRSLGYNPEKLLGDEPPWMSLPEPVETKDCPAR